MPKSYAAYGVVQTELAGQTGHCEGQTLQRLQINTFWGWYILIQRNARDYPMQVFLQIVAFSLQSDRSGRPVLTTGKHPKFKGFSIDFIDLKWGSKVISSLIDFFVWREKYSRHTISTLISTNQRLNRINWDALVCLFPAFGAVFMFLLLVFIG